MDEDIFTDYYSIVHNQTNDYQECKEAYHVYSDIEIPRQEE